MTYFVEGIQGSGKSTLIKLLSKKCPDQKVLEEGDYSPVELAWCAYMSMEDYKVALEKFPSLKQEIEAKTHFEDDHAVVCYTKIRTDDHSFYQAFEKYEIYNGRVSLEQFKDIVLKRYSSWDGEPLITECALFQNIVEDMILFRDMSDEAIIDFYRDIKSALGDNKIHIAYLKTRPDDIRRNLETARRDRVDDNGNEVWFTMLCDYFDNSPHAVRNGLKGEDGLVRHWIHRQDLELRICEELFPDCCTVLPSKSYEKKDIDKLFR
ncbi:MAG: deoxynucleoside kinase [Clostridia bacterium]|nr:deoxynucleoside kinase [Clostridia bacterium]